jgi:hypothetical protein
VLLDLKQQVLLDLHKVQRLIRQVHDGIDPQFHIATPEGDFWIGMTLVEDVVERRHRFSLVSDYMAWKGSCRFVVAAEIMVPDAVAVIGVSKTGVVGALSVIERSPLRFDEPVRFREPQWMERSAIGEDVPGLLPPATRMLGRERIAELEEWFGPNGKSPAIRVAGGDMGHFQLN